MIDVSLGLLVSSLPWWIAAPLLQLAVLVFGMALDETYVNRTTVLTGAIAVHIHQFVADGGGVLVALYADIGLIIGFYGLYTYVVDGYVPNWFRLVAYFVYSPLSAFLVILMAGPTLFGVEVLVVPALVAAGYANHRFREYLRPREPYYFGPESQAVFETVVETEAVTGRAAGSGNADPADNGTTSAAPTGDAVPSDEPTATETESETTGVAGAAADTTARDESRAPSEATTDGSFDEPDVTGDGSDLDRPSAEPAAATDSSERGILPAFMRRL